MDKLEVKVKPGTFSNKLLHYRRLYLKHKFSYLDESSTRIIVNHLLSDVLGFKELTDIKTEVPIAGGYIDYLVQVNGKNVFVVEVKAISAHLAARHLRQAVYYAVMVGAEWIILTNARNVELYRVHFHKPIKIERLLSIDLRLTDISSQVQLAYLTKRSVNSNKLNKLRSRQ